MTFRFALADWKSGASGLRPGDGLHRPLFASWRVGVGRIPAQRAQRARACPRPNDLSHFALDQVLGMLLTTIRRFAAGHFCKLASFDALRTSSERVFEANTHQRDAGFDAETTITGPILAKNPAIHVPRDPSLAFLVHVTGVWRKANSQRSNAFSDTNDPTYISRLTGVRLGDKAPRSGDPPRRTRPNARRLLQP